jgi:hypothetical protein
MRKLILLIVVFNSVKLYSQDSVYYKIQIDSILLTRAKMRVKKIKAENENLAIRYFYTKKTKELSAIEIKELAPKAIWLYNYHFINSKLIMLNKYNNHLLGDKLTANAFYYTKDNVLIYKEEHNTKFENLNEEIRRAEELKSKAPNY